MRNTLWSVLGLLILGACASTPAPDNWPGNAPPYDYFVDEYQRDAENRALQSQDDYMLWVMRFYRGRPGILGWQDITDSVVEGMTPAQRRTAQQLARNLGQRIAAEWAKANDVRVIDTAMLSLWGNIMVNAIDPGDRLEAMRAIDRDTRALLEGDLPTTQITEERYARFDSFF